MPCIHCTTDHTRPFEVCIVMYAVRDYHTYMYVYVAVPRQGSMSAASANAVLSGHCNIFVGRS